MVLLQNWYFNYYYSKFYFGIIFLVKGPLKVLNLSKIYVDETVYDGDVQSILPVYKSKSVIVIWLFHTPINPVNRFPRHGEPRFLISFRNVYAIFICVRGSYWCVNSQFKIYTKGRFMTRPRGCIIGSIDFRLSRRNRVLRRRIDKGPESTDNIQVRQKEAFVGWTIHINMYKYK